MLCHLVVRGGANWRLERCSMYLTSLLGLESLLFIIVAVFNKFSANDWKHSVMNVWQWQSSAMWHYVVCLRLQSWRNSALNMETECFFETLVPTYNSTWHHIAEDHSTNTHCLEYLQISWMYEIQSYAHLQIIVTWILVLTLFFLIVLVYES